MGVHGGDVSWDADSETARCNVLDLSRTASRGTSSTCTSSSVASARSTCDEKCGKETQGDDVGQQDEPLNLTLGCSRKRLSDDVSTCDREEVIRKSYKKNLIQRYTDGKFLVS